MLLTNFQKIFLIFLIINFNQVNAEWVVITDDSKGKFSVEDLAIRKDNNTREYWGIQNLRVGKDNIKSAKALHKVDCISGLTDILYMAGFSEINAKGNQVFEIQTPKISFSAKEKPELTPITNYVCTH